MNKKKLIIPLTLGLLFSEAQIPAHADSEVGETFVTLGTGLNESTKQQMLQTFKATNIPADHIILVDIEEEKKYLSQFILPAKIGKRSISSSKMTISEENTGIVMHVNREKIDWVTDDMYINALVALGVQDAEVYIDSPTKVSGTGALTGLMKIYETSSGKPIAEEVKTAVSGDMVGTAQLAEALKEEYAKEMPQEQAKQKAEEEATQLAAATKTALATTPEKERPANLEEMRPFVIEIANNLNIDVGGIKDETINNFVAPQLDFSNLHTGKFLDLEQIKQGFQDAVENKSFSFNTQGATELFMQGLEKGKDFTSPEDMQQLAETGTNLLSGLFTNIGEAFHSVGNWFGSLMK